MDLEREQLHRSGRTDLADSVRWVAREDGDGAGYDIRAFRPDGSDRLIEVKTTNLGRAHTLLHHDDGRSRCRAVTRPATPCTESTAFARDPRIYVLDGSVEERARLEPKVFLGIPL